MYGELENFFLKTLNPEARVLYQMKKKLGEIFDEFPSPEERENQVRDVSIRGFCKYFDENIFPKEKQAEMDVELSKNAQAKSKKSFVEGTLRALQPLLRIREDHLKEYEEVQMKYINEREGYTELNRLVCFERDGDVIKLHHPLAHTIGPKLKMYMDAMRKLAKIIEADSTIKQVEAVSWIVAKAPKLFIKNGFTVEPIEVKKHPIKLSFERLFFIPEDKEDKLARAYISREDFLKKFLTEKEK